MRSFYDSSNVHSAVHHCECDPLTFANGNQNIYIVIYIYFFITLDFTRAAMASSSGNDDDLTIPRAAINKMIKETLPNVRVANDARELVVNCCTEFIHLISSEANEICNKSDKKTISPEHVINALESLGFASYITEVKDVLQECKTVALKRRKASSRLENLGIPEEELLRQQQELFAKARQQQAELAQQEWLQMQQAAQQAQMAAASASAAQQAGSSQDEDEEDDM